MKQKGFTLIELVVVIVILGILAATALPKFLDLSGDAEKAAVQGVAGALSSGTAINYGKFVVNSSGATAVAGCDDAVRTLVGESVAGYTITASGTCAGGPPKTVACVVSRTGGNASNTATATVTCTN